MYPAHLGKSNFPMPSDMNKAYIDSVRPESLEELKAYVELCLEKVLSPQTMREKMHTLHVESLLTLIRVRMETITPKTDQV